MKLAVRVDGDLRAIYGSSAKQGKLAVTRGVGEAGRALQANWRSQIGASGLGPKLARTVRLAVYPQRTTSFHAAALVWSRAGTIADAFETGALIRSQNGFYLAIPLPAAGIKGIGGKRITPGGWEQRTGRRLQFIYRPGKPSLLVDTGTVARAAPRAAFGERQREHRGFKNRTVPIFVLKRQVKLPKKLSLMNAGEQAISGLPERIVANWMEVDK